MVVTIASKILIFGFTSITLGFAAMGTGVLFASYTLSLAKNPEESENLFNSTLMGFALIETFVFISILLNVIVFFI